MSGDQQIDEAQRTWDETDIEQVRDVGWLSIGFLSRRQASRFTRAHRQPLEAVIASRYSAEEMQSLRGLALVCGDMVSEKQYFSPRQGIKFVEVDGYDISPESLKRVATEQFAFNPHVQDVNDIALPRNTYDLIIGSHGIHHVFNLGGVFYQARKSLKPQGLLVLHEWVGPPYLQIPLRNHFVASLLLMLLFPLRSSRRNHQGRVKGLWLQYPPEAFDPSEACNADELMPQLLKYFKPIRMVTYGGLMYPMFEGLGHKIDDKPLHNRLRIAIAYYAEVVLTRIGVIKPLFMSGIFERREDIHRQRNWQSRVVAFLKSKQS